MKDRTTSRDELRMAHETSDTEPWPIACHRCGAQLTPGQGSFYVVKIEAFADPTPPTLDEHEPLEAISTEIDELLAQMGDLSQQELMDQVYRRLVILLCSPCYQKWIENPAG